MEFGIILVSLSVGPTALASDAVSTILINPKGPVTDQALSLAGNELCSSGVRTLFGWTAGAVIAAGLVVGVALGLQTVDQPPQQKSEAPPTKQTDASSSAGSAIQLGSTNLRHPHNLRKLWFSADGTELVSYGLGQVRRWTAKTGAEIHTPLAPQGIRTTFGIAFLTPDSKWLISPNVERNNCFSAREYDLATGQPKELFVMPERMGADGKPIDIATLEFLRTLHFALSPDGKLLVEGQPEEAYLWDLSTGKVRHHIKPAAKKNHEFLFTADSSQLVITAGDSRDVRFWDVNTGKETRVLTHNANDMAKAVNHIALSKDGRWAAGVPESYTHGIGAKMTIWDLNPKGQPRIVTLVDDLGFVIDMAFGADGLLYIISDPINAAGAVITKWDPATGEQLACWIDVINEHSLSHIAISSDGTALAVGTDSGVIRLLDPRTGKDLIDTEAHHSKVTDITFNPAGTEVRSAASNGDVRTWDATNRKQRSHQASFNPVGGGVGRIEELPDRSWGETLTLRYSADGRWVVSTRMIPNGRVPKWVATLWDRESAKQKYNWDVNGSVKELLSVPGNNMLIGRTETKNGSQIQVWDVRNGEAVSTIARVFIPLRTRFAVFPNGKTVLAID